MQNNVIWSLLANLQKLQGRERMDLLRHHAMLFYLYALFTFDMGHCSLSAQNVWVGLPKAVWALKLESG